MSEHVDSLASNQTILAAFIGLVGTIVIGAISFFGGRGSVQAQLQGQLNLSFKEFTDQLQEERTADRSEVALCKHRCAELGGQIRELEQHVMALENLLRRHGVPIPERPKVATVFVSSGGLAE